MPQELFTKYHGKIVVDKSWQNGIMHIGRLADGKGYVHMTGVAINTEDELRECIPRGANLEAALEWFANRDKPIEKPQEEIKIVNGELMFADGRPISGVGDLVNNIPPGAMLDAAYEWWKKKQKEDKSTAAMAATRVAKKVMGDKEE